MNEIPRERRVFTNRTLNMRVVRAVGYDMDYTLVHYDVKKWEALAFRFLRERLVARGWPVENATFEDQYGMRGLVIDHRLGNIVKANQYGYIKKAMHGFAALDYEVIRKTYKQDFIEMGNPRWSFVNTFFSLSELCMFAHAVDAFDKGMFGVRLTYDEIASTIRKELDAAHLAGDMKRVIEADPGEYVELDPDSAQMLMDQRKSGKRVMLITNSDWRFTNAMMTFAYDRYMSADRTWIDLFDLVVVSARKPAFFTQDAPIYSVDTATHRLSPVTGIQPEHKVYEAGNAEIVENWLGYGGDSILYVGDHVFSDVNISKAVRRWRTCLILRELESEIAIQREFAPKNAMIDELMQELVRCDERIAGLRLALQNDRIVGAPKAAELNEELAGLRREAEAVEERIRPLVVESGVLYNENWGLLSRTGNDKSLMSEQIEQHADIYTSRVSNFFYITPFAYLRSVRGTLPHD